MSARAFVLGSLFLLLPFGRASNAAESAPSGGTEIVRQVLELNGTDAFVELPPDIFGKLDEATVEAWVKPAKITEMRVFNFGALEHDIGSGLMPNGWQFFARTRSEGAIVMEVPIVLETNRWIHFAAVTGKGGMRLYINGTLVGTNSYTGSFSETGGSSPNFIGHWKMPGLPFFQGELDDFRVWRVARWEPEIRRDMFKKLSGTEPNLVGNWNFEDGTPRDSSTNRYHGKLQGNARVVTSTRPSPGEFGFLTSFAGKVLDLEGRPLHNAEVVLTEHGSDRTFKVKSSVAGTYRFLIATPSTNGYRLSATKNQLTAQAEIPRLNATKPTLDLTLYEAPKIFGKVTTAGNVARAGVKVELETRPNRILRQTLTSASGEYHFRDLPAGEYRVRAASGSGPVYFREGAWIQLAERAPASEANLVVPVEERSEATEKAANQVARFEAPGSYIEVPSNIFNDLDEATVEGWVRWEQLGRWSRFFDFGNVNHTITLTQRDRSTDFDLERHYAQANGKMVLTAPHLLETNRWAHFAVVMSKTTIRLFCNGTLVGAQPSSGSFSAVKNGDHNYFGRNNWHSLDSALPDFIGAMDELRVWAVARTAEEIRADMWKRLSGGENGLVALWNFDDPTNPGRDATPNDFRAELKPGVHVESASLPEAKELTALFVLYGSVTSDKGPVPNASVQLETAGREPMRVNADERGDYRLVVPGTITEYTLSAEGWKGGRLSAVSTNLAAQSREIHSDIRLEAASSTLSGKVVGLDGTPLNSVIVQAISEPPPFALSTNGLLAEYYALPSVPTSFEGLPPNGPPLETDSVEKLYFPDGLPAFAGGGENLRGYARWSGAFHLNDREKITFHFNASSESRLQIDGKTVKFSTINHWFSTEGPKNESVQTIDLEPGEHRLVAEAFRLGAPNLCSLFWEVKGSVRSPFPVAEPQKLITVTNEKGEFQFNEASSGVRYRVRAHVLGGFAYAVRPGSEGGNSSETNAAVFEPLAGKPALDIEIRTAAFKTGTWKSYTRTHGLAHDQVMGIREARDGALWISTFGGGVSRWDGRNFRNYTVADGLASDVARRDPLETSNGEVWFSSQLSGVSRWDGQRFQSFTTTNGLAGDHIESPLAQDEKGRVWICSLGGLSIWNGTNFVSVPLPPDISPAGTQIFPGLGGKIWLGTRAGLFRRDQTNWVAVTGTNGIPAGPVFSLAEGADGTLWLANFNGLIRLKGREWQRFEYTDGWFGGGRFPMKVDASGTLWSGGGGGVSRFDGHSFITYRTSDGLSLDRVEALEQDHEGVWWFGTFGGGLSRFDEHHGFRLFTGAAGLPANYVTSLAEDKQARSGPR